jgi:hypothetical protein
VARDVRSSLNGNREKFTPNNQLSTINFSQPAAEKLRLDPEKEKEMWRRHNIESRLADASLSFTEKIRRLEEMEEVARAFHGGKLARSADEHEDQASES